MDVEASRDANVWRRFPLFTWLDHRRTDAFLASMVILIFLLNLIVSLGFQGDGIWVGDRWSGYRMHLIMSLWGFHLIAPIAAMIHEIMVPGRQYTFFPQLAWISVLCAFAWLNVVAIASFGKEIPVWRRALWSYLIAIQIASFAAVHWSTLGN